PLLLEALDAAEGDPCSAHRLLCGDSLRPRELSRLHLQVEAELLLHVALQLALAEERTEPAPPTTGPADHARLPSRGLSHLLDRTESRGPGPPAPRHVAGDIGITSSPDLTGSRGLEHLLDRSDEEAPARLLLLQPSPARRREGVELRPPPLRAPAPLARHPAPVLEAVERRPQQRR